MCAAMAAIAAAAKEDDPLLRMLNSKASGSAASYEKAAGEVAAMAAKGKKGTPRTAVAQLLTAVASQEPDAPRAARLDAETHAKYLEATNTIRRLAVEKDNGLAWYLLALATGETNCVLKAVERKNVQALNAWGTYLLAMAEGEKPARAREIRKEAQRLFKDAAAKNDANGMYNLGMCLSKGYGGEVDMAGAFQCFRTAADTGHSEAINNVGFCFKEGIEVEKDAEAAKRWYKKSSDQRNPYGMFNYATMIDDESEAARLFKASAEGGCVEAMDAYALLLAEGRLVDKNLPQAFLLFKKAAAAGNPAAMSHLADCYERGLGVRADERKSTEWHIRARAARGDRSARIWLNENAGK